MSDEKKQTPAPVVESDRKSAAEELKEAQKEREAQEKEQKH